MAIQVTRKKCVCSILYKAYITAFDASEIMCFLQTLDFCHLYDFRGETRYYR